MGTYAKRHFRALVASAIFGAMLGLGSGPASALVIDFDPDPTGGGFVQTFETDGFRFEFLGGGVEGNLTSIAAGGQPGGAETRAIDAFSFAEVAGLDIEIITIALTGGGFFTFDSIYIDSNGGGATTVAGFNAGGELYSAVVGPVFAGVVDSDIGGLFANQGDVNKVELRSTEFDFLIFDSFTVNSQIPEPGTLALFVTGLIGLGLLSRRRRQT